MFVIKKEQLEFLDWWFLIIKHSLRMNTWLLKSTQFKIKFYLFDFHLAIISSTCESLCTCLCFLLNKSQSYIWLKFLLNVKSLLNPVEFQNSQQKEWFFVLSFTCNKRIFKTKSNQVHGSVTWYKLFFYEKVFCELIKKKIVNFYWL